MNDEIGKENFLPKLNPKDGILAIHHPVAGNHRVRKVVTRSRFKATGKFPSQKMGRMLQWESIHERNAFRLLEVNPSVISYYEQPMAIQYLRGGVEHVEYPDLLVIASEKKELWDIKSSLEVRNAKYISKVQFLVAELAKQGYAYRVVIAETLTTEPRYTNAITLLKYGRYPISGMDREMVRRVFLNQAAMQWKAIAAGFLGNFGRQMICRLVLDGAVQFDINEEWTDSTPFYWATNQQNSRGRY